jgi:uncharacterized ferritin-like protein (DUF455 family)
VVNTEKWTKSSKPPHERRPTNDNPRAARYVCATSEIEIRLANIFARSTDATPPKTKNMSDNGDIEVATAAFPVLPKEVSDEIGSVKLFNKWSYEDVEVKDISLT